MDKTRTSKARKAVLDEGQALERLVKRLLGCQGPLTPGKFTPILVKCARQTCRCHLGERHQTYYLYVTRGVRLKRVYVPKADQMRVQEQSERYGEFRADRVKLRKVFDRLMAAVDDLEAGLTERYREHGAKGDRP